MLTKTIAVLALAGLSAAASAQQGVRSQAPRRDAGEHALRMLAESRANRPSRQQPAPVEGPSNRAPVYPHQGKGVYNVPGITIGGRFGDVRGRIDLGGGHYGYHPRVVYVNRAPYYCYNGGYYRTGYGYYDGPNRRQVVQSPTVIVIDRTGVSTNEVDPAQPITIDESQRVSPKELGTKALHAGEAGRAVDFLTEHVLANEGDREAERLLGVALVLDGRPELGIALISRAYKGDPELAFRPLTRDTMDSLSSWRSVQRDVQRYANIQRTASAWLAAIALTQSELPMRTHAERLEHARRAGLDVDVADAFQRYLEGGEPMRRAEPGDPQPAAPAEVEEPPSAEQAPDAEPH